MQIGLAKTPMMHGGITSAEVGFTQCTFFSHSSPTLTYICLQRTSFDFYSLPLYINVTHRKYTLIHRDRSTQRERCVFISVWFDSSHAVLSCPLLDSGVYWVKKSATGREGTDKGSGKGTWDCQSRKKILGAARRTAYNSSWETPCIQISPVIGWPWS